MLEGADNKDIQEGSSSGLAGSRNALVYLVCQSLSLLGDTMLTLALGVWVKSLTGSSSLAGLTIFFSTIPIVFAPLAGVVVDRFRRRPMLIIFNCVAAIVILPLLMVKTANQLWVIYFTMVAYGCVALVQSTAQAAFVPSLVRGNSISRFNSALIFLRNLIRLFGPPLGAIVLAISGKNILVIADSLSFLVAAIGICFIPIAEGKPDKSERPIEALVAGLHYLRFARPLRDVIVALALGLAIIGLVETVNFSLIAGLHLRTEYVAVLLSAQGIGAISVAPFMPAALRHKSENLVVSSGLAVCALGSAILLLPALFTAIVGSAILGAGVTAITVASNTFLQRSTPKHLLGRVDSAASAALTIPYTFFIGLGALMVGLVDFRFLVVAMVAIMISGSLWLRWRSSRNNSWA